MTVRRLSMLAVAVLLPTVLALAASVPAGAISGYPLTRLSAAMLTDAKKKDAHTCQAGRRDEHSKAASSDPRNPPVVACEQPPRSRVSLPGLDKAATSALSIFG